MYEMLISSLLQTDGILPLVMGLCTAFLLVGCAPRKPPGADLTKCGVVLKRGGPDTWDGGMVESPVVWYDSARRRYGMVYSGYNIAHPDVEGDDTVGRPQIGLAWSDDLFEWSKDPRSPIFGPSDRAGAPDAAGTTGPFLWSEDGTYFLFYIGTTAAGYEGGRKTINLAISEDLIHWKRHPGNPIIEPQGTGWRRDAIWHPHVREVDDTYYLFFNASGVVNGHAEETIGYATSTDLVHWTVHDEVSPVLVGSRREGEWDATGRAGDPSLYRVGDTWYMAWYSLGDTHAQDGLAFTSAEDFPLDWSFYARNPVLEAGPPGSFDALHAHKPFVVHTDTRHYHFYTAVDTAETREIALAVDPGPCVP